MRDIIGTCQKFNECLEHRGHGHLTRDDIEFLSYFELELAKSIIEELDYHNAKKVAKIILSVVE